MTWPRKHEVPCAFVAPSRAPDSLGSVACTEGTPTSPRAPVPSSCHLRIEGAGPTDRLHPIGHETPSRAVFAKFSKGYLDTIYSYDLPPPVALYVRLDLTEDRKPESFSMSLTDETSLQDGPR